MGGRNDPGAAVRSASLRRELTALIDAPANDTRPFLAGLVELFAEGLDAEVATYRPELTADGWRCEMLHYSTHERMMLLGERSRLFLRDEASLAFAHFDPLRVQPEQRNILFDQNAWARQIEQSPAAIVRRVHKPLGLDVTPHMRVTLTDGSFLLAWFGLFREEPFFPHEEDLLRDAIPALAARLRVDRGVFGGTPASFEALASTLELISLPAFLMTRAGRLALANTAGEELLCRDRSILEDCEAATLRGVGSSRVRSVSPLQGRGGLGYTIVTASTPPPSASARLLQVAREHGLTAGESRVLAQLLGGDSNKDIATKLGLATRTIEVHLTAIMRKCHIASRARLIAWFWSGT